MKNDNNKSTPVSWKAVSNYTHEPEKVAKVEPPLEEPKPDNKIVISEKNKIKINRKVLEGDEAPSRQFRKTNVPDEKDIDDDFDIDFDEEFDLDDNRHDLDNEEDDDEYEYVYEEDDEYFDEAVSDGSHISVGANKEDLSESSFVGEDLENVDFSDADLRNVDFSGANLKNVNFSGADLSGAIFDSANLQEANFTGATLNGVVFYNADIKDAILLDIDIDDLGNRNLQELVEYLAKYHPNKLNLNRLNLAMLDLRFIDLSQVSLRGIDFTGVDFTGVNIMGLDLSQCIITPEQIAQALGRVPSLEELNRILEPKQKEHSRGGAKIGEDIVDFFLKGNKDYGVWHLRGDGVHLDKLLKVGKEIFRKPTDRPEEKEDKVIEKIQEIKKEREFGNSKSVRMLIEQRKLQMLKEQQEEKRKQQQEALKKLNRERDATSSFDRKRGEHER